MRELTAFLGSGYWRGNFPLRNWIVAGMSLSVLTERSCGSNVGLDYALGIEDTLKRELRGCGSCVRVGLFVA
jgi:hypothetical protein